MRTTSRPLVAASAGALALLAAACGSKSPAVGTGGSSGGGGAGGSSGAGGGGASTGFLVPPNANGFVWFVFADSIGPDGTFATSDCAKGGFTASQCTQVTTPSSISPFAPSDSPVTIGKMCTSGTAALVIPGTNGQDDYSDLWGGGIGLDFNNPGGDAGAGTFDLSKYGGISFNFTGAIPLGMNMRVNFPFAGGKNTPTGGSPYWANNPTANYSPIVNGPNTILWANVVYISLNAPPFDPTRAYGIEFQVFTNKNTATPYNFCVDSLTLLPK